MEASNCGSVLAELEKWYRVISYMISNAPKVLLRSNSSLNRSGTSQILNKAYIASCFASTRLTFPLVNIIKQLELLLQAYCFETIAGSVVLEDHEEQVTVFAQDLVQYMALYLCRRALARTQRFVSLLEQVRTAGRKRWMVVQKRNQLVTV